MEIVREGGKSKTKGVEEHKHKKTGQIRGTREKKEQITGFQGEGRQGETAERRKGAGQTRKAGRGNSGE